MEEHDLFVRLLQIEDPAVRLEQLNASCGENEALRQSMRELLAAHARAADFLETAAPPGLRDGDEPVTEQAGATIGPYKLLQAIGDGGMGVVFMAEQSHPVQRRVALKIIKPGMDTKQVIARFEAERQALALMDHPNIAKVLDAGTTGSGRPYFVMELVKGVPITKYCDEKRLPLPARLALMIPVCQAIQHAHQKGIIHRDIKPNNVLVAQYDGRPVPKVIDFGVAKATAQRLTESTMFTELGQVIGTVEYMSPEQAELNQMDIDTRSDIYSLGVMLYELLTGSTPLDGKRLRSAGLDEMRRIIREEDPTKPSTKIDASGSLPAIAANRDVEPARLSHIVRGELDWIVMKALDKDRNRRYETANGFALDIQRYLDDEPVTACPPSFVYRLSKTTRRHRAALATATLVAAALVVGLGVATWQAIRATHAATRASNAESLAETRLQAESMARVAADKATLAATNAAAREKTARDKADQIATESRIALAKSHVATGARLLEAKKYALALPWFVEALRVNEENKQPTAIDRMRIGMVLQQCPKPVAVMPLGRSLANSPKHHANARFDHRGIAIGFRIADVEKKKLQVFDIGAGKPLTEPLDAGGVVKRVRMSPDGRFLAAWSVNQLFRLWEISNGRQVFSRSFSEKTDLDFDFAADGSRCVLLPYPERSTILDTSTGAEIATKEAPHGSQMLPSFSSDNKEVIWTTEDPSTHEPSVHIWNVVGGIRAAKLTGHSRHLWDVRFSQDGKRFSSSSFDSTARTWDAATFAPISPFVDHDDGVRQGLFSPDDSLVLTVSFDQTARLWNATTGAAVVAPFQHDGELQSGAFSSDGRFVITGAMDGTARIWHVDSGKLAFPVLSHHDRVVRATFSDDARLVLTSTADGLAHLWDLANCHPSQVLIHDYPSPEAKFAPDGGTILVGGARPAF